MADTQQVLQSIYRAIDELNALRPDRPLGKSPDTVLFGERGQLDSLGLVSLIFGVESQIGTDFSTPISLADDRAMSRRASPFRTVATLAAYVVELLDERAGG
ncbi:MAG: hypothetical protein AB7I25_03950 [Vicinamibacterales bacterium]